MLQLICKRQESDSRTSVFNYENSINFRFFGIYDLPASDVPRFLQGPNGYRQSEYSRDGRRREYRLLILQSSGDT